MRILREGARRIEGHSHRPLDTMIAGKTLWLCKISLQGKDKQNTERNGEGWPPHVGTSANFADCILPRAKRTQKKGGGHLAELLWHSAPRSTRTKKPAPFLEPAEEKLKGRVRK